MQVQQPTQELSAILEHLYHQQRIKGTICHFGETTSEQLYDLQCKLKVKTKAATCFFPIKPTCSVILARQNRPGHQMLQYPPQVSPARCRKTNDVNSVCWAFSPLQVEGALSLLPPPLLLVAFDHCEEKMESHL